VLARPGPGWPARRRAPIEDLGNRRYDTPASRATTANVGLCRRSVRSHVLTRPTHAIRASSLTLPDQETGFPARTGPARPLSPRATGSTHAPSGKSPASAQPSQGQVTTSVSRRHRCGGRDCRRVFLTTRPPDVKREDNCGRVPPPEPARARYRDGGPELLRTTVQVTSVASAVAVHRAQLTAQQPDGTPTER